MADTDADTEPLTVNSVNGSGSNVGAALCGSYGTLTLNANGTYTYVVDSATVQGLDSGETVTDQFTYTVTDGTATSNTSTLTITVFGNNDAPVAVADTNWAQEDLHTCIDGNVILGANHSPDNTEGNPPSGTFADVADTDADTETLTVNSVNGSGAQCRRRALRELRHADAERERHLHLCAGQRGGAGTGQRRDGRPTSSPIR